MKDQRAPNPDEWEFHRIPSGEVSTALRWELCREAGAELRPWLDLGPEERRRVVNYVTANSALQDLDWIAYGNAESFERFNDVHAAFDPAQKQHVMRINWNAERDDIRAAFEALIEANALKPERTTGGRPPRGPDTKLLLIAALRAHNTGLGRAAVRSLLKPVSGWAKKVGSAGLLADKHFAATIKEAKALVAEHPGDPLSGLFSEYSTPERLARLPEYSRHPTFGLSAPNKPVGV